MAGRKKVVSSPIKTESGLTKNQIISELSKSTHGDLKEYVSLGQQAAKQDMEFFQHLISWNRIKGNVRDSKVALPLVSLSVPCSVSEFSDNAWAHLALLGPREFLRALRFARDLDITGNKMRLVKLAKSYLRNKEANQASWDRVALQHRKTLKELYAYTHTKPMPERANIVLYRRDYDGNRCPLPSGSVFESVASLSSMSAQEAAGVIISRRIPFIVAHGALGKSIKDSDLGLALIERMTPTELMTNAKMLEDIGLNHNPVLRGAFDKAMEKAAKSKKNVFKTTKAADNVADSGLREKLRGLQEKQIDKLGGPEGSWLVLADKSGSMSEAIDLARLVSATLARMVKGNVYLVFFDVSPRHFDVTGKSYDEINSITRHVGAGGGTSIGCGLQYALDSKLEVDGIAVISDGGENTPPYFHSLYPAYCRMLGKDVPVYFYKTRGEADTLTGTLKHSGIDCQEFPIGGSVDFYSITNLVTTMRTNRYSLIDEIMNYPLLSLDDVFKAKPEEAEKETEYEYANPV